MAASDTSKSILPVVASELRPRSFLGASSLFCCPSCLQWARDCGVGYCAKETMAQRLQRRAVRADAVDARVFREHWNATKPEAVPA